MERKINEQRERFLQRKRERMREKERERERERGECVRVLCLGLLVYDNMYVMFSVCVCAGRETF